MIDKMGSPLADIVAERISTMIMTAHPDLTSWAARDFALTPDGQPDVRVYRVKEERRRAMYRACVFDKRSGDYLFSWLGYTYADLVSVAYADLRNEIEHRWAFRGYDNDEDNGYPKHITEKPVISAQYAARGGRG